MPGQGPTDPAEVHFDKGLWGFDATVWRKLALLWGYTAIWDENLGGVATGAAYSLGTSAIPSTEVRVLQAMSIRNTSGASTNLTVYIARASGSYVVLAYVAAAATNVPLLVTGTFVLRTGDIVSGYLDGLQVNDVIQIGIVGYKMAIAE